MTHSLLFDDLLELIDPTGLNSDNGYWFETLAGTSWGEAQPVEVAINSLLRDGALTQTERDENREVNVLVKVNATDGMGVTEGTKALNRATRKRTTLVWTPPDGYADPRVFEVETSSLHSPDDFDDLAWVRNEQVFRLRLVCLPYWRSATLTTEGAEGIPSVGTVIDDGSATTGWSTPTATISPAPSAMLAVVSGRLAVQPWRGVLEHVTTVDGTTYSTFYYSATRTLSQAIATGAYVSFECELESPYVVVSSFDSDGGTLVKTVTITSPQFGTQSIPLTEMIVETLAPRRLRYTFKVSSALTLTSITVTAMQYRPSSVAFSASTYPRMFLDTLAVAASASLGAQVLKTINVGGSARTTGAIHVAAPSDSVALGQVLAFTVPQSRVAPGFRPDIAQWVQPGATTGTDGGRSGVFTGVTANYGDSGSPVFNVPASMIRAGAYTVALVDYVGGVGPIAATFGVEASLMIGATVVSTQDLTYLATATGNTWTIRPVGTMYLPPTEVQSSAADVTVRFRVKATPDTSVQNLFLLPVTGDYSIIDCGTGTVGPTASSHLWIDSPSADQPQGGYWRGATSTRANALSAWSTTVVPGTHSFEPELMLAFVTSAAQGPSVSFDYYEKNY